MLSITELSLQSNREESPLRNLLGQAGLWQWQIVLTVSWAGKKVGGAGPGRYENVGASGGLTSKQAA